jgi:hypothetical protein
MYHTDFTYIVSPPSWRWPWGSWGTGCCRPRQTMSPVVLKYCNDGKSVKQKERKVGMAYNVSIPQVRLQMYTHARITHATSAHTCNQYTRSALSVHACNQCATSVTHPIPHPIKTCLEERSNTQTDQHKQRTPLSSLVPPLCPRRTLATCRSMRCSTRGLSARSGHRCGWRNVDGSIYCMFRC